MMRKALVLLALLMSLAHAETPRSGLEFQSEDVQQLQSDDFANPAMLWVARGEALWKETRGTAHKACTSCHGDAAQSMRGVAARYPMWDAGYGRVVTLDARVNGCVVSQLKAEPLKPESDDQIGLLAYITLQSRGMPMDVDTDGRAEAIFEKGRELFNTRIGQMNLSCAHCHELKWGHTLLAEKISQGQPTGWPAYRLEWQTAGTLERRLRACFLGVRAEMPAYRSDDLIALQFYLAGRAQGLAIDAPGVRR